MAGKPFLSLSCRCLLTSRPDRSQRYMLGARCSPISTTFATRPEEGLGATIVSSCDAPPVLQAAEHDLDAVAALVAPLVVFDRLLAVLPAGNAYPYPLVFQRFSEPFGIIPSVRKHPASLWQAAQQGRCSGVVAHLPGRHEELDRASFRVGDCVQLGVHAAFRSPDLAPAPPFFTPRLEAVRCAFR